MLSCLALILFGLLVLHLHRKWKLYQLNVKSFVDFPGPQRRPIIGNVLELQVDQCEYLRIVHRRWVADYGDIYVAWAGTRPIVAIAGPELMEPILSSSKLITKADEYSYLSAWLGNCLFLATGDAWRNRRRLLTPAFHFQILNSFVDTFNDQSAVLIEQLRKKLNKGPLEIDICPLVTQCTLSIICETSMGKQDHGLEEMQQYCDHLHRIGQITMERGVRPWLMKDWIFNLTALGRENRRCVEILHRFTDQVIAERKMALQNEDFNENLTGNSYRHSKLRLAFLDLLIQAQKMDPNHLSDREIREEVDLVMFAGHDTTACTLIWFLYCIAKHPEEQEKVFEELNQVFANSNRPCSTQDVANLKYLECCIKETLRLYPSVPAIMRRLTEDVQTGGYTIPAGTSVGLLFYGMHHNPRVYSDPDCFKPERFLPENSTGRHPYAFVPFSAGPRNCIGQKYGMLEVKVVLANLLRHFRFSVNESSPELQIPSSEIVLKPPHGMNLVVCLRS